MLVWGLWWQGYPVGGMHIKGIAAKKAQISVTFENFNPRPPPPPYRLLAHKTRLQFSPVELNKMLRKHTPNVTGLDWTSGLYNWP